jgi:O-antigen/teichoic acid export membrane protein
VRDSVLAVICVAYAACGSLSWVLDFVLPHQYQSVKFLVLATVAQPLLYLLSEITGAGIGVTRRSGFAVLATGISLVACVGLNVLLIPLIGAAGAALAGMLAFWLLFILKTEVSARVWQQFPRFKLYALTTFAVALATASILYNGNVDVLVVVSWVLFGCVSCAVCWREWKSMIDAARTSRTVKRKQERSSVK